MQKRFGSTSRHGYQGYTGLTIMRKPGRSTCVLKNGSERGGLGDNLLSFPGFPNSQAS